MIAADANNKGGGRAKEIEEEVGKVRRASGGGGRGDRSHSFSLFEDFMSSSDSMSINSSPRSSGAFELNAYVCSLLSCGRVRGEGRR